MGASGGLLVAWNEQVFGGHLFHTNDYSLSITFTSNHNGESWILSNIYGPCQHKDRNNFIDWFKIQDGINWLVLGYLNYVRYPDNRNRDGGNIIDMLAFSEAISNHTLIEIPLKGKNYTWSNMQDASLLEKLDWCFTSEAWTLNFPSTFADPLDKTTSGHVPIMIKICTSIPGSNSFRFENVWLEHNEFQEVVKISWCQDVAEMDSAKTIATKFKRLREGLKIGQEIFLISRKPLGTPTS